MKLQLHRAQCPNHVRHLQLKGVESQISVSAPSKKIAFVWTQFLQNTLNSLNTLQGVQGPWWEPKSSKSWRRKAQTTRKNWFFKIRPEFRCRISQTKFFSAKDALRRRDFEDLGSHQGPWTPCKVLSKFKLRCGSRVQTFDTRFASEISVFGQIGVGVHSIIINYKICCK